MSVVERFYVPFMFFIDRNGKVRAQHHGKDRVFYHDQAANIRAILDTSSQGTGYLDSSRMQVSNGKARSPAPRTPSPVRVESPPECGREAHPHDFSARDRGADPSLQAGTT